MERLENTNPEFPELGEFLKNFKKSETYEDVQRELSFSKKEKLYRSFEIRRVLDFANLYNQPVCSAEF